MAYLSPSGIAFKCVDELEIGSLIVMEGEA